MAQAHDFPFGIMDVAQILNLHVRRRQQGSVYVDCPFCGDKRGKMNINFAKNAWRCNYCDEHGGMLALYAKVYGISTSDAYREICETLQTGLSAPEYTVPEKKQKDEEQVAQSPLASIQQIHQTLSLLFGMLTLSPKHREHLKSKRGLSDEQIKRLGYKSTPPFYLCLKLTERLLEQGCTVQGVPGFYVNKEGKWTVNFSSIAAGIIIPARGVDGLLRGAQIRLDTPIRDKNDPPEKEGTKYLWLASSSKNKGVTSGSPVHFVGDPFARVIYVTEGLLKADVTHCLIERSFIAVAGANNVSKLDPLFALLARNGTELIIEAQDMDKYRNEQVGKGASKIYLLARQHGLDCRRLAWNPNYKGIDDWQLALKRQNEQREDSTMNFKEKFLCGFCEFDALDDHVDVWHHDSTAQDTLRERLGLTEDEYRSFMLDSKVKLKELLIKQRDYQDFRIYQLDFTHGKSTKPFAYSGIKALYDAGYDKPPAAEYRLVHEGEIICPYTYDNQQRLRLIYKRYSGELPDDYSGQSISPSTVIELYGEQSRKYYYCDEGDGFIMVSFSPMLAKPMISQ